MTTIFDGKVGILQRVLPNYRIPFFDTLSQRVTGGVTVFTGSPKKSEGIHAEKTLQVAKYWKAKNIHLLSAPFYVCIQIGWRRWLEETQPEILIVEANPRYPNTKKVIEWMHKRNRLVLGWGLGAPIVSGKFSNIRVARRRKFLSLLDGIISYSSEGANQYKQFGFPDNRVFISPNSVAPKPIGDSPIRNREKGYSVNIIFLGRLQQRKRIDLLLSACKRLPEGLQPNLTIVGDGPAKQELEALAKSEYPKAKFVGNQEGDSLNEFLQQSDLFVMPGTGGLAIQQAMATGLPVIVAEGDGTQNDLVRAGNGWLIKPNDLNALVKALENAILNKDKLLEMGKQSFLIARNEINVEAMANKFIKALNSIQQEQSLEQ
jgi:glycosyltransferase involved in cell wall biosynthesis